MTLGELLTRVLARMLASGDNQPQLARGIISHRLARARVNAAAHEAAWLRVRASLGLGLGLEA